MRVRDHIVLSTAAAGIGWRWLGPSVAGLWAGGVLIDADHYLWFCLHERGVSPRAAVRFFNAAHAPQHAATRALHRPTALIALLLASARLPRLLPLAAGMLLHASLDAFHDGRMDRARAAALHRDRFACQTCGSRGPHVGTHIRHQPWLLPSYRTQNLISLCGPCHAAAHAG